MNKKIFAGLIILMGISILGIIAVQLIWINNAIKVKNELFGRSVTEALNNSVIKLEHLHELSVFNQMVFTDSVLQVKGFKIPPPPPPPKILKKDPAHSAATAFVTSSAVARAYNSGNQNTRIQIITDSAGAHVFTYKVEASSNIKGDHNSSVMIRSNRPVLLYRNDSAVGNLDSMYKFGMVRIDSVVTHLDTIGIVSPNVKKRVEMKAVRLKQLANQVVTEINAWDVRKVDSRQVEKVLKEEFENNQIPIKFEFGIIRDKEITDFTPTADTSRIKSSVYQTNLYPNDIIQKNLKLSVYFPDKESFILRSLNWLLGASFLFSLVILATFALSIFFILRQKKISEMKSDFINNMTHEFKTPIATISVAVDSITNEKVISDPEKIRYFAGMVKKENTRMNRQVEDILTIARLDKKEFEFNWEPVHAHDLINDVIQSIVLQVEKRGGKISTNFQAVNPVITSDKNHFANMIYNLLDNANKYSPDVPEINVSTKNTQRGIMVSVEDRGIGMTKAVQSHIFERFYRQSSGNIHNVKGFGLGLNYVKAVVEANRGTISVQSETGKGSRFDVFLPFLRD